MGAKIEIEKGKAVITGVNKLKGAKVFACDLRAGAALITAGLNAEGRTEIYNSEMISRGYEDIINKLKKLGAKIKEEI